MAKEIFAKRLVELREKNNISQNELAEYLGVTRQSLSLYETAERTINIDLLEQIAKYFNVSSDYLLGISDAYSVDLDIQTICKKIGCSEDALKAIQKMYDAPETSPYPHFLNIVYSAQTWVNFRAILFDLYWHVMRVIETTKAEDQYQKKALKECLDEDELDWDKLEEICDRKDASEWKLMKHISFFASGLADEYMKKEGYNPNADD